MPNERGDFEGEIAERAKIMMKSRAGYIGSLTKLQGNNEELMENYMQNFGRLEIPAEII